MNLSAIDTPTLQGWLSTAMTQYAAQRSGQRVTTASYAQGDGSKNVSFNSASIADLSSWVLELQRELASRGIGHFEPRRAIGLTYGPWRRRYGYRGQWQQI